MARTTVTRDTMGSPSLTIGTRNVVDAGNFFKGQLDEIKLFDGPLNEAQVRAAMQSPVPREFAVAFRDGVLPASLAAQRAALRRNLTLLEDQAREMRAQIPPEPRMAMAIREGGTPDSLFPGIQDVPKHNRGRYDRLGKVVPRRMPQFLAGMNQPVIAKGSGRRELAEWIASEDNPLTARVIVNRVWQHHFGKGLVGTTNNFGLLGAEPTHPELLDWLACWFIDNGWSLKKLHRLIVTSATYQQSSWQDRAIVRRDAANHMLTRMPSSRLESEPLRDAMLAVAGRLDHRRGGPAKGRNDVPRRSLYIQTRRFDRNDYAMLFDCANPEQVVAQRSVSITAPQALFLLNNTFVKQQAKALAARVSEEVQRAGGHGCSESTNCCFPGQRPSWNWPLLKNSSPVHRTATRVGTNTPNCCWQATNSFMWSRVRRLAFHGPALVTSLRWSSARGSACSPFTTLVRRWRR
ncbi:MAG: hypothetical protein CM1200mP2_35430 [Planctomycetaceae bacterium]|nr:MAG: hypothetical protein CM1200mP2_35430 [Planctomycetaceae bacterium]